MQALKLGCRCGTSYRLALTYAGKSVRCRCCNNVLTLPGLDQLALRFPSVSQAAADLGSLWNGTSVGGMLAGLAAGAGTFLLYYKERTAQNAVHSLLPAAAILVLVFVLAVCVPMVFARRDVFRRRRLSEVFLRISGARTILGAKAVAVIGSMVSVGLITLVIINGFVPEQPQPTVTHADAAVED